jgi:hypothetical protein
MAVTRAFRKRSAIARVQNSLAAILDEHQLTSTKATRIAQTPPRTRSAGFIEW